MSRRVLVTGSTGYIGSHLTARLLKEPDIEVFGFNRTYDIKLPPANCLEGHLMETDLARWLEAVRPDIVFHSIGVSPRAPFRHQLTINADGLRRMLQALIDVDLRPRVVVVGSASEYGLRHEVVDENSVCSPEGEYGISKLAQTHIARSFTERYDLPVLVGRVFNVYGESPRHLAVASMAGQVVQAEAIAPLPSEVHVYNLRSQRDFIHIDDVTEALIVLAEQLSSLAFNGQIYNIASGRSMTIGAMLDLLLERSRLTTEERKKIVMRLHGPQREEISRADISKIRQHTGWAPSVSLADGLTRELAYWRSNIGYTVPRATAARQG